MIKNRFIKALLASLFCFFFIPCKAEEKPTKHQEILTMIGSMLERQHYLLPVINDDLSKSIWNASFAFIDKTKSVLLQSDINSLKRFETSIDNEIHGDSIRFYPELIRIYKLRYKEANIVCHQILAQPFSFNKNDIIQIAGAGKDYPKNEEERASRWKADLKCLTLEKLLELQDQRKQSKPGDPIFHNTDAQLEQQARNFLLQQNDRLIKRFMAYSDDKLFDLYINIILHTIDPHSDYLAPAEKKAYDEKLGNRFYGIGVSLGDDNGIFKIMALTPGSPSWKSSAFDVNDQLLKVGEGEDGHLTDVTGMELSDVTNLIRGQQGTTVKIGYKKADGSVRIASLIRQEIKQEDALARSAIINEHGKKIGYISLPVFYDDFGNAGGSHCAADIAAELNKLKAEHVNGIIMDLRNNGGGSLGEVVKMLGLFVGNGPVVQVRSGNGEVEVLNTNSAQPFYSGPLTVLVNGFSASASEIFAGAIQDYKRGIVIGCNTFGKGTVQTTLPLNNGSYGGLKLTVKKFYRVNGGSTQIKGVIPDVIMPDSREVGKYHEGDKPNVMQWDKIDSIDHKLWSVNIDSIAALAESRIVKDPSFGIISKNNEWLSSNSEQLIKISVAQYKVDRFKRIEIARQDHQAEQLPWNVVMDITPSTNYSKEKETSYGEWLKKLSADIYINQAANLPI